MRIAYCVERKNLFAHRTTQYARRNCLSIVFFGFPVVMAEGNHLFPSRTQSLSPPAPMVLQFFLWESRTLPGIFYWEESMGIEIISFDMDGTLVETDYNDLIWQKAIPELVAEREKIDFETALKIVQKKYDQVGAENNKWYDIKYWINFFGLEVDYEKLLQKYEDKISIFPEVPHVLDQLAIKYRLICISSMPREFLIPKTRKLEKYFQSIFSTLSDYQQLKNKEIYSKICRKLQVVPGTILHVGDHEKSDYLAAKDAGLKTLLIDRYQLGYKEKYHNDVIYSLSDILMKIKLL
jgi:5'-nucleotidase